MSKKLKINKAFKNKSKRRLVKTSEESIIQFEGNNNHFVDNLLPNRHDETYEGEKELNENNEELARMIDEFNKEHNIPTRDAEGDPKLMVKDSFGNIGEVIGVKTVDEFLNPNLNEKFVFNVNDKVTVKLTDAGVDILRKHHMENMSILSSVGEPTHVFTPPKNNEYTTQFWQLMYIFGEHLHMGFPIPFETTVTVHRQF